MIAILCTGCASKRDSYDITRKIVRDILRR